MDPGMGFFPLPAATGVAPPSSQQQQQVIPYGVEIPTRVFVGGCPYNMTELELSQFFTQFGEVRDTKIITDRDGGKSKGYGFVTFAREEDAVKVYSQGSIYYDQKKLNVSKAIRKYGGQYKKANQEYVDGQRMVWMHPNGYLMSRQEGGWNIEQAPSHSQPVKLCYSFLPAPPSHPPRPPPPQQQQHRHLGMYYTHPPTYHTGTNPWVGVGPTPNYNHQVYNYPMSPHYTHIANGKPLSAITTSGNESLESSGSSLSSSHPPPPPPHSPTTNGEDEEKYDIDVKALEEKAKQLCLDSAYTSEIDLDTSHSSTATNSGATSPKIIGKEEKAEEKEKEMEEKREEDSRSTPQHQSTKFKEFIPNNLSPSANLASFSVPPLMQPSLEQQYYQQWQADPHSSPHYITASPSSPASLQIATQQILGYGYSPATLQALPPKLLALISSPMATSPHLF